MTPAQSTPDPARRPAPSRWTRTRTTQARYDFHHPENAPRSQRQFARDRGLPRSTLGHWLRQHRPTAPAPEPPLPPFPHTPPPPPSPPPPPPCPCSSPSPAPVASDPFPASWN